MPLSNLLKSAAGICPFCHQKAAIMGREHPECRRTFQAGLNKMVNLASEAARNHQFYENALRLSLPEIARRPDGDGATVNQALEDSWKQGMGHAPWPTGSWPKPRRQSSGSSEAGSLQARPRRPHASQCCRRISSRQRPIRAHRPRCSLNRMDEKRHTSPIPHLEKVKAGVTK